MHPLLFGVICLLGYFAVCATIALVARKFANIPDELFRKILHFILLCSLFVFVYAFEKWYHSVITCVIIVIVAFPILAIFEKKYSSYSSFVTERKKGELKNSLIWVFFMFASVISICWGWIGDKILCFAVIFAWGFGDAFAALIGKKFGKKKVYKKKSLEGTLSMLACAFITVLTTLLIHAIVPWYASIIISIIVSAGVTAVELYTHHGLDTVTCPFTALALLLPLLLLFGGI